MKYTPGKWLVKYEFNVFSEKDRLVAACGGHASNVDSDKVHDENIANAKLVAAAPEMYEALNKVCSVVCKPGMDCDTCDVSFVEKVLQKARGDNAS